MDIQNLLFVASHSEMLLTGQVQPNAKILPSPLANPKHSSRGKQAFSMTDEIQLLARLVYFCNSCLCEKKHVLTKQNEQALVLETGLTGLAAKKNQTNQSVSKDNLKGIKPGIDYLRQATRRCFSQARCSQMPRYYRALWQIHNTLQEENGPFQ